MSEIRPELALWVAYLEKKEELEKAQDCIEKLRAALIEINDINAKRSGYNKAIEAIIWEALEGGKDEAADSP